MKGRPGGGGADHGKRLENPSRRITSRPNPQVIALEAYRRDLVLRDAHAACRRAPT
jgi:hypothetical protein